MGLPKDYLHSAGLDQVPCLMTRVFLSNMGPGDSAELESGILALDTLKARLTGNGLNRRDEMSWMRDGFRNIVGIKDVLNVLGEVLPFVFRASPKVRGKILARHSIAMTLTDDQVMHWVNAKLEGSRAGG
jgi:hypothetical protein